jgi:predicted transcriptional regulator
MFHVSLDQAKRLSRYSNLLEKEITHLHTSEVEKIQMIGIKTLYLSSSFKQEDWEGLTEILSSINEYTKRDEYPLFIQALQEKSNLINDFQQEIERKLKYLNQREQELQQVEENMNETKKELRTKLRF